MAERDVRIKFTGDAKALKGAMGDVRKAFIVMLDDANDARSAGEKLGDAYKLAAEKMRAELQELDGAVEVVTQSMGPEFVSALEQQGRSVADQVAEWKRLGLTYDDIRADADQLTAGLKEMDSAGRRSGEEVGAGLRKISTEGDNSRNVLANMVGNSAQDLGELGGIAGTAGVAIGQLAEYAADGNISLAGLAKVAGPMLGLGVGIMGVNKLMDLLSEKSRELKKETGLLVKVQQDLADQRYEDAAAGLAEEYGGLISTMKQYGFSTKEVVGAIKGEVDLRPRLQALLDENSKAYDQNDQSVIQTRIHLEGFMDSLGMASTAYGDASEEINRNKTVTAELEQALRAEDVALGLVATSQKGALPGLQRLTDAGKEYADAQREQEDALRSLNEAMLAKIDTDFALYDSQQNLIQTQQDAIETVDDAETAVNEADQAQKDYARAALDVAEAVATQAEAQAEANGKTLTAKERQDLVIASLQETAATMAPGSNARRMIEQYIAALLRIPADVVTAVRIIGGGQGDLGTGTVVGTRASGGPVSSGRPYLVGEEGPELVVPRSSGTVIPAAETAAMLGGGGTTVVQLVLNDRVLQEIAVRGDQLRRGTR